MATITQIVRQRYGAAGSNGSWRVEWDGDTCELWHYSHRMLRWNPSHPSDPAVLDYSTGWGSVSDQGGMNQAFRELGLRLRFERAGGATIRELDAIA